jgi:hypothetical protein
MENMEYITDYGKLDTYYSVSPECVVTFMRPIGRGGI